MNVKIALPMENGLICPHFGHCEYFAVVTVEAGKIVDVKTLTPPEHKPGVYPKWISSHGVTDVIAGGIGEKAIKLFNHFDINVFVGAPVNSAEQIVTDFVAGNLKLEANCCNHGSSNHHHNCQH